MKIICVQILISNIMQIPAVLGGHHLDNYALGDHDLDDHELDGHDFDGGGMDNHDCGDQIQHVKNTN